MNADDHARHVREVTCRRSSANRVSCAGRFDLPLPADACRGLFTPEGERRWTTAWRPVALDPPDTCDGEGAVFTTWDESGEPVVWRVGAVKVVEGQAETLTYANTRCDWHTDIAVTLTPRAEGTIDVTVVYDWTALTPAGAGRLRRFDADYFRGMLAGWRQMALAAASTSAIVAVAPEWRADHPVWVLPVAPTHPEVHACIAEMTEELAAATHHNPVGDRQAQAACDLALIAVQGGHVLGTVLLGTVAAGQMICVHRLYVRPVARGHRIGRRLMEAVEQHALQAGIAEIGLHSSDDLQSAANLYRALDYSVGAPADNGERQYRKRLSPTPVPA